MACCISCSHHTVCCGNIHINVVWLHTCNCPRSSDIERECERRFYLQVFFIRDGIKFPDLVRCLRPNPKNHLQEGWRILDFLSHHPESIFVVSHMLSVCLCGC